VSRQHPTFLNLLADLNRYEVKVELKSSEGFSMIQSPDDSMIQSQFHFLIPRNALSAATRF
jgi:hypothetical protein